MEDEPYSSDTARRHNSGPAVKEEKERGKDWLEKLFTPMLQLLSHTGKTKTSLLHHLASEVLDTRYEGPLQVEQGGGEVLMLRSSRHHQRAQ